VRFDSTSVRSARYDSARRDLDIEYSNGGRYRYHAVPDLVYRELLAAESKGLFVNRIIKPHFSFTELAP
jgi:hypothetical protein